MMLVNNFGGNSKLRFYEAYNATGNLPATLNYTSFQAPAALAANVEYTLPAAAGAVGQQLTVTGVAGTTVTLGWAAASDRMKKTEFQTMKGEEVLRKFATFELGSWRYDPTLDPKGMRHYGIMAQDFNRAFGRDAFGLIGSDTTVDNIDLHGVAYLAIQGLEERTRENASTIEGVNAEVARLREENRELKEEIERLRMLEERINRLENR